MFRSTYVLQHFNCQTVTPLFPTISFVKPEGRGFNSRWCHWNFPWTYTVFTRVIYALFLTKILYLNLGCVIYARKRFYVGWGCLLSRVSLTVFLGLTHSCPYIHPVSFKQAYTNISLSGFGGLEVACWPLVPKFAGSNPAEAVGFFMGEKSSARLPSEEK